MVEIIISQSSMTSSGNPSRPYIEGACLSTDTKPDNCSTGSIMVEVDTGDVYFFDGTSWVKQFSFQG